MRLQIHFLTAAAIATLSLFGCEDVSEKTRKAIIGDWELAKGLRNQKETESLAGTTFHFGEDGNMATNLPIGIESPAAFELEKNTITQKGRQTVQYAVQSFTDSTLVLSLEMRGITFEMHLRRYVPQPDSLEMGQ